jgi:hypothetical protein
MGRYGFFYLKAEMGYLELMWDGNFKVSVIIKPYGYICGFNVEVLVMACNGLIYCT